MEKKMSSILMSPKKKKSEQASINGDDVSGLFYVNEQLQKSQEKPHQIIVEKMNDALKAYQDASGETIPDYPGFQAMVDNPATYYRRGRMKKNLAEKDYATDIFRKAGYSLDLLEENIALPEGFVDVENACARIKREKTFHWENYTFNGESFEFSERLKNRFLNKVYYYTKNDLDKRRLALGLKFIDLLTEWEEVFREECAQAGVKQVKIDRAVDSMKWVGPLPYIVRMQPLKGGWGEPLVNKIIPNEEFVVRGHILYADEISVPLRQVPDHLTKKWESPIRWKRFWRSDFDGGRRPYYVPVGKEEKAYWGMSREANVQFEDGEFLIRDGKFVLAPEKE